MLKKNESVHYNLIILLVALKYILDKCEKLKLEIVWEDGKRSITKISGDM